MTTRKRNPRNNTVENKDYGVETISVKEAREIAKQAGLEVSTATIIQWIEKNNLGHQPGGPSGIWFVFKEKFTDHVTGKNILNK